MFKGITIYFHTKLLYLVAPKLNKLLFTPIIYVCFKTVKQCIPNFINFPAILDNKPSAVIYLE